MLNGSLVAQFFLPQSRMALLSDSEGTKGGGIGTEVGDEGSCGGDSGGGLRGIRWYGGDRQMGLRVLTRVAVSRQVLIYFGGPRAKRVGSSAIDWFVSEEPLSYSESDPSSLPSSYLIFSKVDASD